MIHFELLHDAYVQRGNIQLKKYYRDGYHHVQGLEQIIPDLSDPDMVKQFPLSFQLEWAQFIYPGPDTSAPDFNPELTYDKGAYNIGVPVFEKEYISMPKITKVTLLYMRDVLVSNGRTLVQLDHAEFQPISYKKEDGTTVTLDLAAYINLLNTVKLPTRDSYYDFLTRLGTLQGYNRTGSAMPPFITESHVDELSVLKGQIEDSQGDIQDVLVHLVPMYIYNDKPLFDLVYMETEPAVWIDPANGDEVDLVKRYGTSGRLVRWYGGVTSEARAPINYDGAAIPMGKHPSGRDYPLLDQQLVIDGVPFTNADAYNVTRKLQ